MIYGETRGLQSLRFSCCQQALARIESSGEETPKPVVHGFLQILLTSEVAFCGQNRGVAQKELNLLQLASINVTQFCTCPPQIVRRDVVKLHPQGTVPNHIPAHVFKDPVTPRGS